jgi:anthranilate phosphoribosyltransferase
LGAKISLEPVKLVQMLDEIGIAFMFAPSHHAAMRHVGQARKDLGFRTVFNQLGPLANPAGAKRQLIGVYDRAILRPMAEALSKLGAVKAMVVHGVDGLDEISPCGESYIYNVSHNSAEKAVLSPESFELEPLDGTALLPGATAQENASILVEAISDLGSPRARAVLPSVAATLWLAGIAMDLKEGVKLAGRAISSGAARQKLEQVVEATNRT